VSDHGITQARRRREDPALFRDRPAPLASGLLPQPEGAGPRRACPPPAARRPRPRRTATQAHVPGSCFLGPAAPALASLEGGVGHRPAVDSSAATSRSPPSECLLARRVSDRKPATSLTHPCRSREAAKGPSGPSGCIPVLRPALACSEPSATTRFHLGLPLLLGQQVGGSIPLVGSSPSPPEPRDRRRPHRAVIAGRVG